MPRVADERAAVLALEGYFDEHAGPAVRRYVYGFVLRDVALFRQVFLRGYTGVARRVLSLTATPLAARIGAMYKVGGSGSDEALVGIERALMRLEELTRGDPDRYLVGDRLTLADVTAASLLGPLLAPPHSPWDFEIPITELNTFRATLRERPAGRWVMQRYARDRRPTSVATP